MGCSSSSPGGALASGTAEKEIDPSFHAFFELGAKLGQGSYDVVYVCKNVLTKQEDAVKVVSVRSSCSHATMRRHVAVSQERDVWRQLGKHENAVELLQTIWNSDSCYFVMEKCEYALVSMLGLRCENMAEDHLVCNIFPQMVQGLQYCHAKRVIHRDVKPMNFLAALSGVVKIADFGSAVVLEEGMSLRGTVGTASYMSPEMLAGREYDFGTDIWSFATTVYRLLYGEYPHQVLCKSSDSDRKEKQKNAIMRNYPKPRFNLVKNWPSRSDATTDFMRDLLERNRCKRLDATKCLAALLRLGEVISDFAKSIPTDEISSRIQSSTNVKLGHTMVNVQNVLHYDFVPSGDSALEERLPTISPPIQDVFWKMDDKLSGDTSTYFESYGKDGTHGKDKPFFRDTTTLSIIFASPESSYNYSEASRSLPSTKP